VVKEVSRMVPPELVASEVSAVAELPMTSAPSATLVRPVPPPPTWSVPDKVGVKVKAPPEFVMLRPSVWPLKEAEDVAKVMAPVCAEPPPVCWRERRPVFVILGATEPTTVKPEQEMPEEQEAAEVATDWSAPAPFP
jgi:hypothetical protein